MKPRGIRARGHGMGEDAKPKRGSGDTTGNTSGNQLEESRSNRDFRTIFSDECLKDRSVVKDRGTVYDEGKGKVYREMWMQNLKRSKTQTTFTFESDGSVGAIVFERVMDEEEAKKWKYICDTFHYVPHSSSSVKAFGRFLRYFVKMNGQVVGIIAISGSFLSIGARDDFIGWNREQRLRNNRKICQNIIYCILPSVNIPNLSSSILSRFVKVARRDWKAHYGDNLVLMDTLVTPELYRGTSYIASGWAYVGMTKGYGARSMRKEVDGYGAENIGRVIFKHDIKKMIFVKPLHRYWRRELMA